MSPAIDPTRPPYDKRTALATITLVRKFLLEHAPVDWDTKATAQEVVANLVPELRAKIVTSEHWRGELIRLVAEEKE